MNLDLKGKVVVITGPAKGMGRAVTLAFAREGARLVLAGRDTAAIEEVAGELAAMGAESLVVKCDMTRSEQTERLATEALAHFGSIDVLVNVAGGSGPIGKTGWETTQAEFDDIVQLNMTGCFNTMRAVMPAMIEQGAGKIVNVGGTFGMRGRAGRMAYSASKWGLRGITKVSRWKPAATASMSTAWRRAWSMGRAFATRSAPTWPTNSASRLKKRPLDMPKITPSSGFQPTTMWPMPACFWPATLPVKSRGSICR